MTRRVILLHGPPASGKLTTARALAERINAVILHNHLTFNLARILFDIGDERLLNLHRELRMVLLRHALASHPEDTAATGDLILTLVYAEPDSVANVAEIVNLVEASGARLIPIYLRCSESELLRRVQSDGREAEGKLRSPVRLRALLDSHNYPPLRHPATRIVDNDSLTADAAAAEIVQILANSPPDLTSST